MFDPIKKFISSLEVRTISSNRKEILNHLVKYIQDKVDSKNPINLNFICTHNSRRSHLSQIWAQTMAHYFSIEKVHCYSGGTEATGLFPMVIKTLREQGFQISSDNTDANPEYTIKFGNQNPAIIGFSKVYDHESNPKSNFAAIMTCSQADEGCPFIPGAETRIPITYEDPKLFDNTPQQAEKYKERSKQIATEMLYIFSQIKK